MRIYLVLGEPDNHLGLLEAMEANGLFDLPDREYFVIGIVSAKWNENDPGKNFRGSLSADDQEPSKAIVKAAKHYLAIMMSPPQRDESFEFASRIREHMTKGPFKDLLNEKNIEMLNLRDESFYLYDAVRIYANALAKILNEGLDPKNGTRILELLKGHTYLTAMGYTVYMDQNGDAEGNYTLLQASQGSKGYGLYPVGQFQVVNRSLLHQPYSDGRARVTSIVMERYQRGKSG